MLAFVETKVGKTSRFKQRLRRFRLQKCFGYGVGESLASASQHEIAVRFPKQLECDQIMRFLGVTFQVRTGYYISRTKAKLNALDAFYTGCYSFDRFTLSLA